MYPTELDESSNILDSEAHLRDDLEEAIDHGILVSKLAYFLAKEMNLSEEYCYSMAEAGLIHDIGKLKLGKFLYGRNKNALVVEEMKYIRMHSSIGNRILKDYGYSDDVCKAVHHHHENYDGSGYPHNKKGEGIPLGARILRICDVYATLISDRRNRIAFDKDTAIRLMIEEIKNFDMKIFLTFVSAVNMEEFKEIDEFIDYLNSKEYSWGNILHDGYY
ncbi:MAG: metal dependent phosphohydrolase [Anaerocolumna sp.]|nr:metal dependent phosphohydrolase [Anaerocolumna sp.]